MDLANDKVPYKTLGYNIFSTSCISQHSTSSHILSNHEIIPEFNFTTKSDMFGGNWTIVFVTRVSTVDMVIWAIKYVPCDNHLWQIKCRQSKAAIDEG